MLWVWVMMKDQPRNRWFCWWCPRLRDDTLWQLLPLFLHLSRNRLWWWGHDMTFCVGALFLIVSGWIRDPGLATISKGVSKSLQFLRVRCTGQMYLFVGVYWLHASGLCRWSFVTGFRNEIRTLLFFILQNLSRNTLAMNGLSMFVWERMRRFRNKNMLWLVKPSRESVSLHWTYDAET